MIKKVFAVGRSSWIFVPVLVFVSFWTSTGAQNLRRCFANEYNLATQVCCGGDVHDRFKDGQDLQCCEKVSTEGYIVHEDLYDRKKTLCCDGAIYHGLHLDQRSSKPECCGDQVILNRSAEFCCGNKRYTYSKKHFGCFSRGNMSFPYGEGERVCHKLMSTGTVEVKLYTKEEVERRGTEYDTDCCGLELYKRGGQYFCFGRETLWPQGSDPEECGPNGTVHDRTKTVCCQETGKRIQIPRNYTERYLGISPNLDCLNDKLVDLDLSKIVCNAGDNCHAIPKHFEPCGSEYFEKTINGHFGPRGKGICCSGKVHYHSLDIDAMCCGTEVIDKKKNNCCNGRKIPLLQMCCGKTIYNRMDDVTCCNGKIYNSSYLCCKPQSSREVPTLKQQKHDNLCCGDTTYHALEGICCDGIVNEGKKVCNYPGNVPNEVDETQMIEREIMKGVEGKEGNRRLRSTDCPACLRYEAPYSDCNKRFKYQVFITKITEKQNRTVIEVLFLEPKLLRKTTMVLNTIGKCNCFKRNTIYDLYTNRNFKNKIEKSNGFRSRFTKRDLFYEVKGNYGDFSPVHKCLVERFYRPIS